MKNVLMLSLLAVLVVVMVGCTPITFEPNHMDSNFSPASSCTTTKGCYTVLNHYNMGGQEPVLVHVFAQNGSSVVYEALDGSDYSSLNGAVVDSESSFIVPIIIASSSSGDPINIAENVLDGDNVTQWRSGILPSVIPQWVKLDLGRQVLIDSIYEGPLFVGRCTHYTISLSGDNVNYNEVVSVVEDPVSVGIGSNINLAPKFFSIDSVQARYVLYSCSEARNWLGNVESVAKLTELSVMGIPSVGQTGREINMYIPKCDASVVYPKPPSNQLTSKIGFIVTGRTSSPSGGEFSVNDVVFGNTWNIVNQMSQGQFLALPVSEGYLTDLIWDPMTSTNAKMQLWCV